MKLTNATLCIASLVALTTTGCYSERVVREPAGATTRTTVRETVTVDEPAGALRPVPSPPAVPGPRVERRVTTAAPTIRETIVVEAPPAVQVETEGAAPTGGHAWVPGHWTREGDRWVWSGGRWELRPEPTSVYVPGHWEARGSGYIWQEGYWK